VGDFADLIVATVCCRFVVAIASLDEASSEKISLSIANAKLMPPFSFEETVARNCSAVDKLRIDFKLQDGITLQNGKAHRERICICP
jgi:hypothetical protein